MVKEQRPDLRLPYPSTAKSGRDIPANLLYPMKYQTMFLSALLALPSLYCQNDSELPKLSLRIGKSIADEYGNGTIVNAEIRRDNR